LSIITNLQHFNIYLKSRSFLTNGSVFRDGSFAASFILPLQYRLLSLSVPARDVKDKSSAMVQACRLACILYFAEIRRLFGIMHVVSTLQTRKLRAFLERSGETWEDLGLLRAWCLALGAIESTGPLRVWYMDELKRAINGLGIESWDKAEMQLKEVLWFEDVHSPMFHDLHTTEEGRRGGTGYYFYYHNLSRHRLRRRE
jgi:hypothetical protein